MNMTSATMSQARSLPAGVRTAPAAARAPLVAAPRLGAGAARPAGTSCRASGSDRSTSRAQAATTGSPNGQGMSTPPPKKESFGDIMGFGGYAPEVINGRLAQLGFVAGLGAEIATGQSFTDQFAMHWPSFLFASGVITLASFMPNLTSNTYTANPTTKKEIVGPFTPGAEMFNSRAAMVGIAAMLIIEGLKGGPIIDLHGGANANTRSTGDRELTADMIRQNAIQESRTDGFEPGTFAAAPAQAPSEAFIAPVAPAPAVTDTTVLAVQEEAAPAAVQNVQPPADTDSVATELKTIESQLLDIRAELSALRASRV